MSELKQYKHAPANFETIDPMYDEDSGMCNRWRADRAADAIEAYWGDQGYEDFETQFKDLLNDLLHWCDGQGIDFDDVLERARRSYQEEQP